MATEERVLCFERKLLDELGVFQGLSLEVEKYMAVVTSSSRLVYLNRSDAEHDKRYKQLIPYVLGLFSKGPGYHEGMRRELMEEVAIEEVKEAAVAVINDDSTEVGQVHFGVVHVMRVTHETVVGRRSGIVGPEFIPFAEAVKDPSGYESWSRFCLEHLDLLLSKAAASSLAVPERVTD